MSNLSHVNGIKISREYQAVLLSVSCGWNCEGDMDAEMARLSTLRCYGGAIDGRHA
jgi:hypothetical protein